MSKTIAIKWYGREIKRAVKHATHKSLILGGQVIARASGMEVPLDQSTLLKSQFVEADEETVHIGYDTPYAVKWHEEDANFQHGRKKKYLEDPINNPTTQHAALEAIATGIKPALE